MLLQTNGFVKKRVRVCFSLIRGSPLWEAYKKEELINSEKDRRVDLKFLTEVVNWMAGQNNSLWQALARKQKDIDNKLAVQFTQTIQKNPIWAALQKKQITFNELEALCQNVSRILNKREEEALLDILLEELSNV